MSVTSAPRRARRTRGRRPACRWSGCRESAPGPSGSRVPPAVMRMRCPSRSPRSVPVRLRAPQGDSRRCPQVRTSVPDRNPLPVSRPLPGPTIDDAALPQGRDVRHRRRVVPHFGVHRRGEHERRGAGEYRVAQQVVGQTRRDSWRAVFAVAGATTIRSAACPIATWRTSATPSYRSVCTGLRLIASRVGLPTKRSAASVATTCTSWPASTKAANDADGLVGRDPAGHTDDDVQPPLPVRP